MNLAIPAIPSLAQQVYAAAAEIERRRVIQQRAQAAKDDLAVLFGSALAPASAARILRLLDAISSHGPCSTPDIRKLSRAENGQVINPSTAKEAMRSMLRRDWIRVVDVVHAKTYLYAITPTGQTALATLRRLVGA